MRRRQRRPKDGGDIAAAGINTTAIRRPLLPRQEGGPGLTSYWARARYRRDDEGLHKMSMSVPPCGTRGTSRVRSARALRG
jgi:hypothetical protein